MPELLNEARTYSLGNILIFCLYPLYFILAPFYFWESGLPQAADFILVFLILTYAIIKQFSFSISSSDKGFLLIGLLFVAYIFIVNLTWTLLLQTSDIFIRSSFFYLYNFLVATIVIILYNDYKEKIIKATYYGVLISVFIQLSIYLIVGGFIGGRMTTGFNNPNQLGYYSLLVASVLMYSSYRINVNAKWFILGIFAALILVCASLSKAAIISFFGLAFFFLLFQRQNKRFRRNILIILFLSVMAFGFIYNATSIIQDNELIKAVITRIEDIGNDHDDNLQARGYDRIVKYPQYWIFGAGEGKYSRFNDIIEFHSTLGNIQVSYGIIGLILFISLLFTVLRNDKYRSWYILLFIMTYGITHNGIRNSMLWILMGLIVTSD